MKTKNLNQAFGTALTKFRTRRTWSQEHLGFESELTRTYISLLERGKRSPTLNTIFRLAAALDVDADEVIRQTLIELNRSHEIDSLQSDQ